MWNAWTAPPGALPQDYDPWTCEAHCARCGELAQDCHCEDDDDMTRCPNCSVKHNNPGNAYCADCAGYFARAGMYSRLSDDGLTFSADDGSSTRADNFKPREDPDDIDDRTR